jgi:DNA-binding MarR family transcriptional regulator
MEPVGIDPAGVWMNFFQAYRVVQGALEERLEAESGLSWSELEVLLRLSVSPGRRLKMADIADQLLASKSGITRLVDRLEANGFISREVPPENRRVVYGRITDAGLETLRRAYVIFQQVLEDAFSRHLSEAEMRELRQIVRKLLEGNGAWDDHRCMPGFDEAAPPRGVRTGGEAEAPPIG